MKTYKHNKKDKYAFIVEKNYGYTEYFIIEKFNNKIKTDYFDISEKSGKKDFQKFQDKLIKQGFEAFEIPKEVQAKTDQLVKRFELSKSYYFIEKNEKDILKSNLVLLSLTKSGDDYNLHRISTEFEDANDNTILPSLVNYMQGYIPTERDELYPKDVVKELSFYLNILFVLGYEEQTVEQLTSLYLPKPITKDTVFEEQLFKHKKSSSYVNIGFSKELKCLKTIDYQIKDNLITDKNIAYSFDVSEAQMQDILKDFNNPDEFEPVDESDFNKQFKEEEVAFFEKPKLKEFDLPIFPLDIPEVLAIDTFFNNIIEENKYYFFANTTVDDPMEWQVAFIMCSDYKENWYLYSKPFALKDFNKNISKPIEVDLEYSDDRKSFAKKHTKAFKKEGLKAISAQTIYEILSGQTIEQLKAQKPIKQFVKRTTTNVYVYTVFENYACVRDDTINHIHWQFFKDENERETWLKENETKETKLYDNEIKFIERYTKNYLEQNNTEFVNFKKNFIKNPLLGHIFSDSYDIRKFNKSKLVIQEAKHIKGDYIFSSKNENYSENKTIIIEGDLIVDGTLFFTENNDNYIIIKGDLKAKNLIVNWSVNLIYVEGKIEISNITKSCFRLIGEQAKTHILLHENREVLDLKSNFKYDYEVSYYSDAITNKEVVTKDYYNLLKWDEEKIYELLTQNKPFLKEKLENTKTDLDEYYKNKFEKQMLDWGQFYPDYAGCEVLCISEDNEIKGNCIYPGGGDWVVNDLRGKSGTYGVSHDDYSICKLKVKNPAEFKIDYTQKPLKLLVGAKELMERYVDISMLYMNWAHRKTVAFTTEKEREDFYKKYEKEKKAFVEDPYLALYWLNHFGATLDKRYDEVLKIVEENQLTEKLEILKEPIAFFKKTDAFYDLKITGSYGDKTEFDDLFLKRRSYLVYWEHVYKNYNPDNLDLWWKSITIYPKVEEQLIVRMRWLKNNLEKCKNWSDFDALIKDEDKNIPLLSYVLACNPNTSKKDKTKYADILVAELLEHKNHFKTPHKKSFAEVLLWDVSEFVSDKEKLQETAQFYFQGNETSKEYQDIQSILGIINENIDETKTLLDKLDKAFEGYDEFDTPKKEKLKYHQKVDDILDKTTPEIVLETALNIKNYELAKHYFVYLWNADIPNKKKALVKLFTYIEFSGQDINAELFGDKFPNLIKDENDPNLDIAKAFMSIHEADFRNDYVWKKSKEAAVKFFLSIAHLPSIFDFLIEIISQAPTKENKALLDAVYASLFSEDYDSKINPTLKFSKEQIETMLQTICNWIDKYSAKTKGFHAICYCSNPLAEAWIKERFNNKKWFSKQFINTSFPKSELNKEIQSCFKSALAFIENEKHNAYLEFKDEKSHKFWKISHYGSGFIVTYGKVGTEGKTTEKEFNNSEEAFKAGDKLIASKLKKGYKRV